MEDIAPVIAEDTAASANTTEEAAANAVLMENLNFYRDTFFQLVQRSIKKNGQVAVCSEFDGWMRRLSNQLDTNVLTSFEMTLIGTIAEHIMQPDEYFYLCSQFGQMVERRIGAAGYMLILVVLYVRYLYKIAHGDGVMDVRDMNHGIVLNMNQVPFGRVVIDVDITSNVEKTVADDAMNFFVYQLLHFVERGSKVIMTRNMDVQNSLSFHLITENQFDIISVEYIKRFIAQHSTDAVKVDIVFMWSLPNGRYHQPQKYFYLSEEEVTLNEDRRPFMSIAKKKIITREFSRTAPLSFDDWMLMAPVAVMRIDSIYSILKESNEDPSIHNDPYMITHKNWGEVAYLTLKMKDSIEDLCINGLIDRIQYLKIFNDVHCVEIPRKRNDRNQRINLNKISVTVGSLRLIFAPHRRSLFVRSSATKCLPVSSNNTRSDEYVFPSEFYEILLHTKLSFDGNHSIEDVFQTINASKHMTPLATSDACKQFQDVTLTSHNFQDLVKQFYNLEFTYTFKPADLENLLHCHDYEKFQYDKSVVNTVCDSIWLFCCKKNDKSKLLLQLLYLNYCQKNDVPMYIDELDYEEILIMCNEIGITPTLPNTMKFGGKLSHRSHIGRLWPDFQSNKDTKILLHILVISLERGHIMPTLALMINSGAWRENTCTWATVFLVHLFEKNEFLSNLTKNSDAVHVSEPLELCHREAPIKMLYVLCSYLAIGKTPTLPQTIQLSFRFSHLGHLLLDMGSNESIEKIFNGFLQVIGHQPSDNQESNANSEGNGGSSGRKSRRKQKGDDSGSSLYSSLYSNILRLPSDDIRSFVLEYVVMCYRIVYLHFIYDRTSYVLDYRMDEALRILIPEIIAPEPSNFNFWYRREMGIYNSFLGTFDSHSPALFSGVSVNTPLFVKDNMCVFNMFDMHLKNRLFTLLAKGIHFSDYLDYQRTALVLCGSIYSPLAEIEEDDVKKLEFVTSSLQVCKKDVHADLPFPPQLFDQLQNTTHLKYIYNWFYMILCEMSKSLTLDITNPYKYIFSCMDPNDRDNSLAANDAPVPAAASVSANDDSSETNHLLACVHPEYLENRSSLIDMVHRYVFSKQRANAMTAEPVKIHDKCLTSLLPTKIHSDNEEFLPYKQMMAVNIWNMDDLWHENMNATPATHIMQLPDINEKINHNIETIGGLKFKLYILLNVSWHVRVLHKTLLDSTRYMRYIDTHRREIYKELVTIVKSSLGPFFMSSGQNSLVEYFRKFTALTSLTVDPLDFHLEPKPGYLIPVPGDKTQLGETAHELDEFLHAGVVSFIIQAQFNRETMVDKLKILCMFTRPINRERMSVGLLNRPRTGKNAFVEKLTSKIFPTNVNNSYRYSDLLNCENDTGNKLVENFNGNLLMSFDEVETFPNTFKTISNNGALSGRRLYAVGSATLYINAHIIFMANKDPICSGDAAIIDRIKVFDRFYQFTSFNPRAVFPRDSAIHDVTTSEINGTFANQCLLQTLPTENANVDEFGFYMLVWQMATLFGHTQQEPCTQRWTSQMERTMSRFVQSTDPAKYIIMHKIKPTPDDAAITLNAFKQSVQAAIHQDKTIPKNNFNVVLHDILDRMKSYKFVEKGVEYITARVNV